MRKLLLAIFLVIAVSASSAAFYQVYIVRANDTNISSLLYDNASTSYKDSSLRNPDMNLRICALAASDLQGKYVMLAYANGENSGSYLPLEPFPYQIRNVPPDLCVYAPLLISSFKAWYPSVPFVFISGSTDMSGAQRIKLSKQNGWFDGAYFAATLQNGSVVTATVFNATDDTGAPITPAVDYLVVGLLQNGTLTSTDNVVTRFNQSVNLSLGSYTGNWTLSINGIGPTDVSPPYVHIISPANGGSYPSGGSPFIFTIIDDVAVDSCWYVLDSVRTDLPACNVAYSLTFGSGSHTLTLYANDTNNNIGSDTVTFYGPPAPSPPPSQGGGPPGTPIPQPPVVPPIIPPPPPSVTLTIQPEDIIVTVIYPYPGSGGFTLTSTANLTDLRCVVNGDIARYASVSIGSNTIHPGETVDGTVTVNMTPEQILRYGDQAIGTVQCFGNYGSSLQLQSMANLYVYFMKPAAQGMNSTANARPGERISVDISFRNNGTADAVNLSAIVPPQYADWMKLAAVPFRVRAGEVGALTFVISVPGDVKPGDYVMPITITEDSIPFAVSTLTLSVMGAPITPCVLPDLTWTILILAAGILLAALVFRMAVREKEFQDERIKDRDKKKRGFYMRAAVLALVIIMGAVIIWAFIVWLLMRCS